MRRLQCWHHWRRASKRWAWLSCPPSATRACAACCCSARSCGAERRCRRACDARQGARCGAQRAAGAAGTAADARHARTGAPAPQRYPCSDGRAPRIHAGGICMPGRVGRVVVPRRGQRVADGTGASQPPPGPGTRRIPAPSPSHTCRSLSGVAPRSFPPRPCPPQSRCAGWAEFSVSLPFAKISLILLAGQHSWQTGMVGCATPGDIRRQRVSRSRRGRLARRRRHTQVSGVVRPAVQNTCPSNPRKPRRELLSIHINLSSTLSGSRRRSYAAHRLCWRCQQ